MDRRKRNRRRLLLIVVILFAASLLLLLRLYVAPMVQELSKAIVESNASTVINEAIEGELQSGEIDYNRIISLEKDVNGVITALRTNINEINRLKTEILSEIDAMLLVLDVNEIGLPLGSIILPELFSGSGPKLPVRVLAVSTSEAEFRNVFSEAGINQTSHQITMDVTIIMTILTPLGTEAVKATSTVVVAETVIVGSVPDSYVHMNQPQPEE